MPYEYPDNIPDYVEKVPAPGQRACVSAYNSTFERTQDEDQARIACWGAVKNLYEQDAEGEWIRKLKEGSVINLEELDTTQKAYAAHNRVHAEYIDARHGARRKAQMQEDHEAVVRHILSLGGRHLLKGEALDDTLPQELREQLKLRYLSDNIICSEEQPATSEIQVIRTGIFHHPVYGKFSITDETLNTMLTNFKENKPTEMYVDWEHMSTANPPVIAPAAGWVKNLSRGDGGLFALVEWTEEAAAQIKKKQYRFISPEFDLAYKDPETGKSIGPTLISVALTNRPFLEGMQPVVLSNRLRGMLLIEESIDDLTAPDLPDRCFAFIKPGGKKDEEGRTVPHTLRHLPYRDKSGKVDLLQLRSALTLLPQTKLNAGEQAEARKVLIDAAKEAGVDEQTLVLKQRKEITVDEKILRETLGIGEDDDILEAVTAIKAKSETDSKLREALELGEDADLVVAVTSIKAKATEQGDTTELQAVKAKADASELELKEMKRDNVVDAALTAGKITPKMKAWAAEYALRDPAGFKAYVDAAERVGPDLTVKGKDGGETMTLTEGERKTAKKLGVKDEDILAQKKADEDK